MKAQVLITTIFLVSITSVIVGAPGAAQPISAALPHTPSVSNGGHANDLSSPSADTPLSANRQDLSDTRSAVTLTWKRSSLWTGSQTGPQDGSGRYWHHSSFDDSSWTPVSLPDTGLDTGADDRYYRAHFQWDGSSPVTVNFVSDDGLSIYINGQLLGTWGNGWRQSGCVNNIITCINTISVPPQTIPTSVLLPGDNVIAIDLWNAETCCFYYLQVVVNTGLADLSISHIEVTQATQTITNSIPLIAGKRTYVRVYVDCGDGCTSLPGITGVLRGFGSGGELDGSPRLPVLSPMTAFHESWTAQRGHLTKTLNFTLPSSWTSGAITLTAEVAGKSLSEPISFGSAQSLNIIYVPIRYKGQVPDYFRTLSGFAWAYRVYPTARINYVRGTTLEWNRCLERGLLCLVRGANTRALLNELTTRYRLVNAYVYGWLPAATFGGGISNPTWDGGAGRAAFGDDHPTEGQRFFAHEIAHLLGRRHTNTSDSCGGRDAGTDWPYPTATIQEWGLDGYGFGWLIASTTPVKNPGTTFDYMSYCGTLANLDVWTAPWTYTRLFSDSLQLSSTAVSPQIIADASPYFISSGLVYTDDTATLDPIWVVTSTIVPTNPPLGTQYCLEAQDVSNSVLASHCFDMDFVDYETGETENVDGFNLMLPYPSGVKRIVLKKGSAELAARAVSPNSPIVSVLSPNGGETWAASGTYTITWTASDVDGDPLTYSVFHSINGSDWLPVGSIMTTTQAVVNTAELAGGNSARIRVMATDGVNTSTDESNGTFSIGRKPPEAVILVPPGNGSTLPGTPLLLLGYASDLEDGVLEDAAMQWSSNQDGALGSGSQLMVTLSSGQHLVTLTATDSDGNTTTASVSIFAGSKIYLPIVLRNR